MDATFKTKEIKNLSLDVITYSKLLYWFLGSAHR